MHTPPAAEQYAVLESPPEDHVPDLYRNSFGPLAMQKVLEVHETELSEVSVIFVGVVQTPAESVNAFPSWSTAAQNEADGQEIDVIPIPLSVLLGSTWTGVDHDPFV
jgi:hypothetical protein